MMIVMKPTATEEQVQAVIDRIESCGARAVSYTHLTLPTTERV